MLIIFKLEIVVTRPDEINMKSNWFFLFLCTGLYLDAQAAFDFLLQRTDIDHSKIIIFGRSLGGAIAIHLAEQPYYAKQAFCLIVENTFTTLPHIARQLFGSFKIVTYLPSWCYKNKVTTFMVCS